MSVVRPEFGPTLPELLAPRVRALPRAARVALAVLAALVVAARPARPAGARRAPGTPSSSAAPMRSTCATRRRSQRVAARAGRAAATSQTRARLLRAVVHGQAVQAAALQGRRRRASSRSLGEHDRRDARSDPRASCGGRRRARQRQPAARLRDPLPGEDRRPHDVRPRVPPRRAAPPPRDGVDIGCSPRARRRPRQRRRRRRANGAAEDRATARSASAPSARERRATARETTSRSSTSASGGSSRSRTSRRRGGRRGSCASTSARDRRQALVGADHELRARGARGPPRARRRELPAAPDRPGALRGARARHLQRRRRGAPAASPSRDAALGDRVG